MKLILLCLALVGMVLAENTEFIYFTVEDDYGNMSFTTQYWCMKDCARFDRPIKVKVVPDPNELCGDGNETTILRYHEGCAMLDRDLIVARNHSLINSWLTWNTISHEFMHFYMWQNFKDSNHSEDFWWRMGTNKFRPTENDTMTGVIWVTGVPPQPEPEMVGWKLN